MRHIGWLLLVAVLALGLFQLRNLLSLRGWKERARGWSTGKKVWDVALSFLIPTIILAVVFNRVQAFMGYRFNFTYQMVTLFRTLPDIGVLMVLGSIPDYIQGFVKLYWAITGRTAKVRQAIHWSTQS